MRQEILFTDAVERGDALQAQWVVLHEVGKVLEITCATRHDTAVIWLKPDHAKQLAQFILLEGGRDEQR